MHSNKVLFIITDLGSFNNFLSELCLSLISNDGFKVSVICSSDRVINFENKFDYTSIGIRFYFVDIPRGYQIIKILSASKKINSIIEREKPNIILAHFTSTIFTSLLLKKIKTKIWGTFHGLGFPVSVGYKKLIYKIIEYFCFLRLDKIIVLNDVDFNSVPKIFKSRLIKINSLGLGCDLHKFDRNKFSNDEKLQLKNKLKISDQFIIAFTGRFVHFKGFNIIAKLFIKLSQKYNSKFKLILIGGMDPLHNSGLTKDEEDMLFDHKDVVKIGFTKDVSKYLSIVDLFVFPSKKEGIPICITEALAMGIPVVTFNSRGCNELVKNGYNGILIDTDYAQFEEINLFQNAIEKLYFDNELYMTFQINAINNREDLSRDNFIKEHSGWIKNNTLLNKKKLLIVVNVDWFFLSHRKDLALSAKKEGYQVIILTKDTGQKSIIEALGFEFIDLPMSRSGTNLFKELSTLKYLFRIYKKEKPDIIHHVGLKTILLGTLAAKLANAKSLVNAITGLGYIFSANNNNFLRKVIIYLLRFSHRRGNLIAIFQNDDDRSLFFNNHIIQENQTYIIKGSGIDLNEFCYTSEPKIGKIIVLITARMIIEKGIFILIDAAKLLKGDYKDKVQFILCGAIDDSPIAIKEEELKSACDGEYICWLGYQNNIIDLIKKSHIIAFPSYYREGIPQSLIEAAAIGRPIITTNSIGCKETVIDRYNGFLIPIKNSELLADRLKKLFDDTQLRISMGKNSRLLAEKDFSIENVITKHLEIYKQLTTN